LERPVIPREKAEAVKLLILDVDGVLTNGQIILTEQGEEIKSFYAKDGHGLRMLMDEGIEVILISGRRSKAVDCRAGDLGIQEVHQGVRDKGPLCEKIIRQRGLKKEQVCCVGDDLPDLPLFENAGISFAVSDASPVMKGLADYVTKHRGGYGAVREVCEIILESRGRPLFGPRQNSALHTGS
jgi:3-deoxy-D-manno-octulosonate 8-phosphate phosphatase (KDO 8-P phosphatase)